MGCMLLEPYWGGQLMDFLKGMTIIGMKLVHPLLQSIGFTLVNSIIIIYKYKSQ